MSVDSAPLVLALDQGGHASRALAFDARGAIVAQSVRAVAEERTGDDRVEQDAELVVRSLREALDDVLAELGTRASDTRCAGLATQRSSIVAFDRESGAALSPVISWQDRRAARTLERIADRADDVHRRTGLFLSPHYGASKMRWCLDELPLVRAAQERGRLALGPLASFLCLRLLAERPWVADPANASRTLLWNLATRDWDPELLALFGIPRAILPACVPTRHAFGSLMCGARAIPLTILNGDQSAAVFAHGAPDPNTLYVNLGTGAFVQRTSSRPPAEQPRLLSGLVYSASDRTHYVVEGTINGAGSALRWIADRLGLDDVEAQLDLWLRSEVDPPLFLNGVSGLAAPYWIHDFPSRFIGEGTPQAQVVAVAESIVFLVQAIVDEMAKTLTPPSQVQIGGGLSQSDELCRRVSDLSRLPVRRGIDHEATARGLAQLLFDSDARFTRGTSDTLFRPRDARPLRARYERWCEQMERARRS